MHHHVCRADAAGSGPPDLATRDSLAMDKGPPAAATTAAPPNALPELLHKKFDCCMDKEDSAGATIATSPMCFLCYPSSLLEPAVHLHDSVCKDVPSKDNEAPAGATIATPVSA